MYRSSELYEGESPIPPILGKDLGWRPEQAQERLLERIEAGCFHSEKDKAIATAAAERLWEIFPYLNYSQEYFDGINALAALVPIKNDRGQRVIGDQVLSPKIETKIISRLASQEVNFTDKSSHWHGLPEVIKKTILAPGTDLWIEMTDSCTVGCHFCVIADQKGPIKNKLSSGSIIDLMEAHAKSGNTPVSVQLYLGSDPFDAKWYSDNSWGEEDYSDLATAYQELYQNRPGSQLFTSTAVPIGEEMRIFDYIDKHVCYAWNNQKPNQVFRFSETTSNKKRVEYLRKLILPLSYNRHIGNITTNPVREHIAKRGKSLEKTIEPTLWDVIGPDCFDGVVITPQDIEAVYVQGASTISPTGMIRRPLIDSNEKLPDGGNKTTYIIPKPYHRPDINNIEGWHGLFESMYPPGTTSIYKIVSKGSSENGRIIEHQEVDYDTPNRSLARLACAHMYFSDAGGGWNASPEDVEDAFLRHFSDAARKVLEFSTQNPDRIMNHVLDLPFRTEPPMNSRQLLERCDASTD